MQEPISAAEAIAWEEALGRLRPPAITRADAERAIEIPSFNAQQAGDGVFLRLTGVSGGAIDLYLNAAVAVQLVNTICDLGREGMWRNEDDGSLIVRDPANLRYAGPKS